VSNRSVLLNIILMLFLGVLPAAGYPTEEESFSRANTLLFLSDHLASVTTPARLLYDFRKTGTREDGFSDTVEVQFAEALAEDGKRVEVNFFTGERARPVPAMTVSEGNPIVMLFLQREVNELGRLTGSSWRHFQKQIKLALENDAEVTPVTVTLEGEAIPATRIRIAPYLEDPQRRQFEAFAETRYEFTLSDEVPGFVYEIHAVTPGNGADPAKADSEPLREEALIYRTVVR
jgi:hypothetical protein